MGGNESQKPTYLCGKGADSERWQRLWGNFTKQTERKPPSSKGYFWLCQSSVVSDSLMDNLNDMRNLCIFGRGRALLQARNYVRVCVQNLFFSVDIGTVCPWPTHPLSPGLLWYCMRHAHHHNKSRLFIIWKAIIEKPHRGTGLSRLIWPYTVCIKVSGWG